MKLDMVSQQQTHRSSGALNPIYPHHTRNNLKEKDGTK
jgi:hypothetical protein